MHTIRIKELKLQTILGIFDWEKKQKRPVILNLELETDTDSASTSDAIKDAVDYDALEKSIINLVENNRYELIEKLVADVAKLVLSLDARIAKVTVEAEKPGALSQAASVSVATTLLR